jgi:hypothetical protein
MLRPSFKPNEISELVTLCNELHELRKILAIITLERDRYGEEMYVRLYSRIDEKINQVLGFSEPG